MARPGRSLVRSAIVVEDHQIPSSSPFQLPLPALPKSRISASTDQGTGGPPDLQTQQPVAAGDRLPSPQRRERKRRTSLPFPSLPSRSGEEEQLKTPAKKTGNEAYFTAIWGSPYDFLSSSEKVRAGRLEGENVSGEATQESPTDNLGRAATDRRKPLFPEDGPTASASRLLQSLATPDRAIPTDLDLDKTPRWSQLQPQNSQIREESEDSDLHSSDSSASAQDKGKRTLLGSLIGGEKRSKRSALAFTKVPKGHRGRPGEHTLTQQQFDNIIGQQAKPQAAEIDMISAIRRDSANMEKPLPPAPHMRTASESPVLFMNSVPESPILERRPTLSSSTSYQRPKKKLLWRGKNCVIALPLDDGRQVNGEPKRYLKPDEVAEIFRGWEDKGYDTSGFNLASADTTDQSEGGRSREIYPQAADITPDTISREYRVRIPNRGAWDQYVKELQEAKLRALGVLAPGEEPQPSASPAPSTMSRQASQTSVAQSMSGGPLSANSFRNPMENRFSPPVPGAGNSFGRPQSLVSPVNHPGTPGLHLSRQSIALPMNQFLGNDQMFPAVVSPLMGPMQGQFPGSGPASRVISPLVDSRSQSRRATHSPVSPIIEAGQDYHGQSQLLPHLRAQDASVNAASISYQPMRSHIGGNFEPTRYFSQPEIASPLPQGHRHNVSESLQREIDEAESHLEQTISQQLEEERTAGAEKLEGERDSSKAEAAKDETPKDDTNSLEATQIAPSDTATMSTIPEERADAAASARSAAVPTNLQAAAEAPKETETTEKLVSSGDMNPGLVNTPDLIDLGAEPHASANESAVDASKVSHSKTASKSSGFAFDPTKNFTPSFTPAMFTFGTQAPPTQDIGLHSKTASSNSAFSSSFNAAAPSFTPGRTSSIQLPSREFSFSSTMPTLKPDAPAFKPSNSLGISSGNVSEDSLSAASRVFQSLDYTDVKPTKQSRAIPIVKPSTPPSRTASVDHKDDEDGRPTTNRENKRARHGGGSGDQVPLFASPSVEPHLTHQSIHKRSPSMDLTHDQLSSPQEATGKLKEFLENRPPSVSSSAYDVEGGSGAAQPSITMAASNGPIPRSVPEDAVQSEAAAEASSPSLVTPTKVLPSNATPDKKSTLSATAKPFRFNPAAGEFSPDPADVVVRKPETPLAPPPKKPIFSTGMASSRFAPTGTSPERESTASPEPEEVAPGEQSIEDRIRNGVSYVDPTDQELDVIMRTLNGDDSDIGVERHPENSWKYSQRSHEQSSSRRSPEQSRSVSPPTPSDTRADQQVNTTGSANQLQQPFQYLPERDFGSSYNDAAAIITRNPRLSPSYKHPRESNTTFESPIHRLSNDRRGTVSDWGSAISSDDEYKINARSGFFDGRVNDIVGGVIDERLQPLEVRIGEMATALTRLAGRSQSRRMPRSASVEVEESDADDEDDGNVPSRALSPLKDRRLDRFKISILEAIAAQRPSSQPVEIDGLQESLAEIKASIKERPGLQIPSPSEELKLLQASLEELKASMTERKEAEVTPDPIQKLRESFEEMKASIGQSQTREVSQAEETVAQPQLLESISSLRTLIEQQHNQPNHAELKDIIEESISKQMLVKAAPTSENDEIALSEKLQIQISGLENMLKLAESRADEEYNARRAADDSAAEAERKLKEALNDVTKHRNSAEESENSLKTFLDDHQQAKQHTAMLEEVKTSLEKNVSDLMEKTSALEETLDEYRTSHTHDKKELDETKVHMKNLDEENQNLDRTIKSLKTDLQDSVRSKHSMKQKIEKLQDEISHTVKSINQTQASFRHKEDEHRARHDLQTARLEAEVKTRERLEIEMERLEKQEKDAMKAKFLVDQIRSENQHLVGLINKMRTQNHELHEQSNKAQRENHDLKESNRQEVQRILNSTKADVAAANQQVHILRTNLESVIEKLENEVTHQKAENKNIKQRYESMLEESSASKDNALREAAEAREAALQEHYRFHERTMDEVRLSHQQTLEGVQGSHRQILEERTAAHEAALNATIDSHRLAMENALSDHERATKLAAEELSQAMVARELATQTSTQEMARVVEEHEKALKAAIDAKNLSESHLNGRIHLADETTAHLRDRLAHLEEKLEIAKSAAQAAADAARAARSSTPQPQAQAQAPNQAKQASIPMAKDSELPEKISPQALRESIMVLQEQLHQREKKIESLEEELSKIDKDAPTKIKEREDEITWLRELFGLRLDDLQELIQTLSSSAYDRDAVRDAAIRLKANLQMEQQERERTMASGGPGAQGFPSLATITASPRSIPMAAAAAWGSWRKGQTSLGSLAEMAAPMTGAATGAASAQQTPSRASPQSFLSGLLTPPSTNLRQSPGTPRTPSGRRTVSSSTNRRPPPGYSTPPKRQLSASSPAVRRSESVTQQRSHQHQMAEPPRTPTQVSLQADDYDNDAQSEHYSLDQYVADRGDEEIDEPSAISTPDEGLPEQNNAPNVVANSVELQAD